MYDVKENEILNCQRSTPPSTACGTCIHIEPSETFKAFKSSSKRVELSRPLYNDQINTRPLICQSAVGYCADKPMEKSRLLNYYIKAIDHKFLWFIG